MYIIRFQKHKLKKDFKNSLRIVVIKKGKAPSSFSQKAILGLYDKKENIISLKIDLLLYWLSQGVLFSKSVYKLLSTVIKI